MELALDSVSEPDLREQIPTTVVIRESVARLDGARSS